MYYIVNLLQNKMNTNHLKLATNIGVKYSGFKTIIHAKTVV
ncbi:hypothetical protein PHEL49_1478 [Polaribacter sp. Hel1_33_49]|nr:hypothetical protein PHEL49_1478 [Polaribacter sp. Hel1_33_49]